MNALAVRLGFLIQLFSGWVNRRQLSVIEYLLEENRLLREQLEGRRVRLTDDQRRRLAVKGQVLGRRVLGEVAGIVTPDTILRWYRRLVARKYDGSRKRGLGRPRTKSDLAALVLRMARENPRWGYTRIRGAMKSLGHEIGRSTVERILRDSGIEPAPQRGQRTAWGTFLAAHWDALAAADFFMVEVLTLGGLGRYFVFFVIRLKTRTVEIAGITCQPTEAWMTQIARNLTDSHSGFLRGVEHLVLDRDPLFTAAFRRLLRDSGVRPLRLPARSPNLNAFAERFVLSIKSECLERMVLLGEAHLRTAGPPLSCALPSRAPASGTPQRGACRSREGSSERSREAAAAVGRAPQLLLPRSCVAGKNQPTEIWDRTGSPAASAPPRRRSASPSEWPGRRRRATVSAVRAGPYRRSGFTV